jgi:hypothetical protein
MYADGTDKKVQFKLASIEQELSLKLYQYTDDDLQANFNLVYNEVQSIF